MSQKEKRDFIKRNYKIYIDRIFEEQEPDGYRITGEILTFFGKLNSLYDIEDKKNLELFIKFLNDSYDGGEDDINDDFIQNQWLEIINKFMPEYKKEAIKEFLFFSFQSSKYWNKLKVLEFTLTLVDKDEKIIESQIKEICSIILSKWQEKDQNWKSYAEKYLDIIKTNFFEDKNIEVEKIQKALAGYESSQ